MSSQAKTSLTRCLRCGSEDLACREVEKLVRGGSDVVALVVSATICHRCGERYFDKAALEQLEAARTALESGDLEAYQPVGQMLRPASAH